jgi:hypothetical protein
MKKVMTVVLTGLLVAASFNLTVAQDNAMSFFLTSAGPGNGADLGGLDGADAHCQALAEAAGAGSRTWRAYLSTDSVNARDRIGDGPWHNADGVLIANNVDDLHSDSANVNKETAIDENGNVINGRRSYLQQLDQQRRWLRTRRSSRPSGTWRTGFTLE